MRNLATAKAFWMHKDQRVIKKMKFMGWAWWLTPVTHSELQARQGSQPRPCLQRSFASEHTTCFLCTTQSSALPKNDKTCLRHHDSDVIRVLYVMNCSVSTTYSKFHDLTETQSLKENKWIFLKKNNRVSLYRSGWPWTQRSSAPWVLGLKQTL